MPSVRLSTARGLQEPLAQAQAAALGRSRDERQPRAPGSRQGSEAGTVQTAAGVVRWPLPHVRGLRAPSRSPRWAGLGRPRDVRTRLSVALEAGGMAQRDLESALEKALGPCVGSQRAVRERTDRLPHA